MCQGLLDGFEANGIRYYNKYATLKECRLPGQASRVLSRMSGDFLLDLCTILDRCFCTILPVRLIPQQDRHTICLDDGTLKTKRSQE
jgi:hypothetical protein